MSNYKFFIFRLNDFISNNPLLVNKLAAIINEKEICPKFMCKPKMKSLAESQPITCPEGFHHAIDKRRSSSDNICIPNSPNEKICSLAGRTFVSFDGLEYKYDVCNHILAMSLRDNAWYIIGELNAACFMFESIYRLQKMYEI